MATKNQHVIPHSGGWAVRREGADRVTKVFKTEKQATDVARKLARNQGADLVVHRKDGTIKERTSCTK